MFVGDVSPDDSGVGMWHHRAQRSRSIRNGRHRGKGICKRGSCPVVSSRLPFGVLEQFPVILISIDSARSKEAVKRIRAVGFKNILWFQGFRHVGLSNTLPQARGGGGLYGEIGCFLSHLGVAKLAWGISLERFLIVEDDVLFCRKFRDKFTGILDDFPDCDALMLGHNLDGRIPQEEKGELDSDPRFFNPKQNLWGTHAILATEKYAACLANPDLKMTAAFDNQLYQMHGDGLINLRVCTESLCGQDRTNLHSHIAQQLVGIIPRNFDAAVDEE